MGCGWNQSAVVEEVARDGRITKMKTDDEVVRVATGVPRPINISLYRATPMRYAGLGDKNSGDAGGDLKFGLWEVMMVRTHTTPTTA